MRTNRCACAPSQHARVLRRYIDCGSKSGTTMCIICDICVWYSHVLLSYRCVIFHVLRVCENETNISNPEETLLYYYTQTHSRYIIYSHTYIDTQYNPLHDTYLPWIYIQTGTREEYLYRGNETITSYPKISIPRVFAYIYTPYKILCIVKNIILMSTNGTLLYLTWYFIHIIECAYKKLKKENLLTNPLINNLLLVINLCVAS